MRYAITLLGLLVATGCASDETATENSGLLSSESCAGGGSTTHAEVPVVDPYAAPSLDGGPNIGFDGTYAVSFDVTYPDGWGDCFIAQSARIGIEGSAGYWFSEPVPHPDEPVYLEIDSDGHFQSLGNTFLSGDIRADGSGEGRMNMACGVGGEVLAVADQLIEIEKLP